VILTILPHWYKASSPETRPRAGKKTGSSTSPEIMAKPGFPATSPQETVEQTLDFYQSSQPPEGTYYISPEIPSILAFLYGADPNLYLSRDDGEPWQTIPIGEWDETLRGLGYGSSLEYTGGQYVLTIAQGDQKTQFAASSLPGPWSEVKKEETASP
jgi:hypothetical protein